MAGYTTLIYEMEEVLRDLSNNRYKRVMVQEGQEGANAVRRSRDDLQYMSSKG